MFLLGFPEPSMIAHTRELGNNRTYQERDLRKTSEETYFETYTLQNFAYEVTYSQFRKCQLKSRRLELVGQSGFDRALRDNYALFGTVT